MYILSFSGSAIAYRQPAHGGTVINHPVKGYDSGDSDMRDAYGKTAKNRNLRHM